MAKLIDDQQPCRHCSTYAPSPPALLLGFAVPTGSDLVTATRLLAGAIG